MQYGTGIVTSDNLTTLNCTLLTKKIQALFKVKLSLLWKIILQCLQDRFLVSLNIKSFAHLHKFYSFHDNLQRKLRCKLKLTTRIGLHSGIEFQALHVLPDILESSCSGTEKAEISGPVTVVIKYRMWILQAQCPNTGILNLTFRVKS